MADDCLFCKLVANQIPSYTVYEDGETRAFLDIYPSAPGHTMVILKKHGWTMLDYTDAELAPLWKTVRKMARVLTAAYKTDVLTIGVNHGEAMGVHHLHVHLIPRVPDDEGGVIQSIVKRPASEDLAVTRKRIAAALSDSNNG
jgi:histidine triad (HIT) family protein